MSLKALLMPQIKIEKKYKINRHIVLEKLSTKNITKLTDYSQNDLFFKFMEYKKFTKKNQEKYLINKIKQNNFKDNFFFVINFENQPIGTLFLSRISLFANNFDLSYGISPKYWGRGIFSLILKKLFIILKNKNINRIQAITRVDNLSSIKVLKKNGFILEGKFKKYYFDLKSNTFHDASFYSFIF